MLSGPGTQQSKQMHLRIKPAQEGSGPSFTQSQLQQMFSHKKPTKKLMGLPGTASSCYAGTLLPTLVLVPLVFQCPVPLLPAAHLQCHGQSMACCCVHHQAVQQLPLVQAQNGGTPGVAAQGGAPASGAEKVLRKLFKSFLT